MVTTQRAAGGTMLAQKKRMRGDNYDTSPLQDAKPNQTIKESYQAYWATQPQPTSVTQQYHIYVTRFDETTE